MTLIIKMLVKRAGHILGESDTRMWRMQCARMKAAHALLSFENVVRVGAKDINRRKEHNYLMDFAELMAKRVLLVPRYFQWERGGLDAHGMMTGDDTGGDNWTVAGAW